MVVVVMVAPTYMEKCMAGKTGEKEGKERKSAE